MKICSSVWRTHQVTAELWRVVVEVVVDLLPLCDVAKGGEVFNTSLRELAWRKRGLVHKNMSACVEE